MMRLPAFIVVSVLLSLTLNAQSGRKSINIPDIPGFKTIKCDFHMHTVFSDGLVWPTVRVEEAWKEGLDVIAITDHIEYLPHKENMQHDHNTAYEIAEKSARDYGLLLIRGTEITKDIPPGHFNALFTKDNNKIQNDDYIKSLQEAVDQGAFIMWNHPGWRQKNSIPIWYEEHEEIYKKGWMHGMEIVNYGNYYPLAQEWCYNKKITMMGSSDIHNPVNMEYNVYKGEHRPMTLVFAKKKTEKSIKEALFQGRTAVYNGEIIYGKNDILKPLLEAIITADKMQPEKESKKGQVRIKNISEVPVKLKAVEDNPDYKYPKQVIVGPESELIIVIKTTGAQSLDEFRMEYEVENFIVNEGTNLKFIIK